MTAEQVSVTPLEAHPERAFPAALYAVAHEMPVDDLELHDVVNGAAAIDSCSEMQALRGLAWAAVNQKGPRSPVLQYQISRLPPNVRAWIDHR